MTQPPHAAGTLAVPAAERKQAKPGHDAEHRELVETFAAASSFASVVSSARGSRSRFAHLDEALAVREALDHLSGDCQEVLDRFFARDESYRIAAAESAVAGIS